MESSTDSTGHYPVYVSAKCNGSRTCKGSAVILGQQPSFRTWSYSIPAGKTGYLKVYWLKHPDNPAPTGLGGTPGSDGTTFDRTIKVYRSGASALERPLRLERRQRTRMLQGAVTGPADGVSDLAVTRWVNNGLTWRRAQTVRPDEQRRYSMPIALGTNNKSSAPYRLSIRATVAGETREWFWRGDASGTGRTYGGGGRVREGSTATVGKYGDFTANFRYGSVTGVLSGSAAATAQVRVIAPPSSRPTRASDLRALDVPYCANEFASTRASGGSYTARFVPRTSGGSTGYLVEYLPGGGQRKGVVGASGQYANCHAATRYTASSKDDDLVAGRDADLMATVSANLDQNKNTLTFDTDPTYSGFNGWDKWSTVREYVPGTKVLDQPIVASGFVDSNGTKAFDGLRPGRYVVEVGRTTQCSSWYPSIYKDNYLYHKGLERGHEKWKTVNGAKAEYAKSIEKGFPRAGKNPPSGYKGWMYRDACRHTGTGSAVTVNFPDRSVTSNISKTSKGATISGKVTRAGGKSNKELLVSVYSTQGTLVMRSAYTGSSGKFVIRGLASGNYRIGVNLDSWRGIGRTFDGTKTKRVTAGKNYSVGTLKFKG
ncbi:carboxypeptidase-like regulatory domain-containing protein [Aeromicrobium sp. 50.2.37]|uniref:carboxypeptidase-like regulatory domain-containing protein n=1 Tax=Aeromicrobium sp. 50.2.37 TaxID=2969305 RepID=UPI00214F91E9|nr:carboxypeptidase-like regulatory domain-containing protein [Aeromicrobium sp. 50.2.37]MCR4511724.1 carboxypeptidase-like regulatory domain-containing protein [Aeromicrobium sp. 50.2.37]